MDFIIQLWMMEILGEFQFMQGYKTILSVSQTRHYRIYNCNEHCCYGL